MKWSIVAAGSDRSLVPRPSPAPVFDRLQYRFEGGASAYPLEVLSLAPSPSPAGDGLDTRLGSAMHITSLVPSRAPPRLGMGWARD